MPAPLGHPAGRDSTGLTEAQRRAMVAELARSAESDPGALKRGAGRMALPDGITMAVEFRHPGGSVVCVKVSPRDVSKQGVGFLHGGFVHQGTACVVYFQSPGGEKVGAKGQVARCVHVTGRVHDVGVKFEREVVLEGVLGALAGQAGGDRYGRILILGEQLLRLIRARADLGTLADAADEIAGACREQDARAA